MNWDRNNDLLTKVEALHLLKYGVFPDDFGQRVHDFVEFYECPNCGGQEDMNAVFRSWFEEKPSWCRDCIVVDEEGNRVYDES